jgi:dihydropteroate synthase
MTSATPSPANQATYWRLRTRDLTFGLRPRLMGIVNVTPDSFSDGGRFFSIDAAVERGLRLVAEGADLLDIGGESTRPYSTPVTLDEELRRVIPVVERLAGLTDVPLSIDTSKSAVARAAVAAGAEIINDVTGLEADPEMIAVACETKAAVCAMHMRGTPQTMQNDPRYDDVVAEIHDYLRQRRDRLTTAGIAHDQIALDPGIGFGKTHEHNLTLIRHCRRFLDLGCPLLVGHSRKGFIGKVLRSTLFNNAAGEEVEPDRTFGTLGVSLALALQGVPLLRVHDVGPTRQALELFGASVGWS